MLIFENLHPERRVRRVQVNVSASRRGSILRMTSNRKLQWLAWLGVLVTFPIQQVTAQDSWPLSAQKIMFIGDSITHAGQYVSHVEAQLRQQDASPLPVMINIGLGSETCSGLSEPDHPFPRPDVHERLERALKKIQPDLVVACYGMNDGIYHPAAPERMAAYQKGIRELVRKCREAGAKVIVMTPPPFDPEPVRAAGKLKSADDPRNTKRYAYFNIYDRYDEVLKGYADWLVSENDLADMVIDLHGPMSEVARAKKSQDPSFTLSPDGIHPSPEGHRVIANTILKAWGLPELTPESETIFPLVHRRSTLLHDAWLSEVGHQRPGVKEGLPIAEAQEKAAGLEVEIEKLRK